MKNTDKSALLNKFIGKESPYYETEFNRINETTKYVFSFNIVAFFFGSIWFASRGLWKSCLAFLIFETIAIVQIIRGAFGNIAAEAQERIKAIEFTLELRRGQLKEAIANNADNVDIFKRTVASLENSMGSIRAEVTAIEESAFYYVLYGFVALLLLKFVSGIVANYVLDKRFYNWLSDHSLPHSIVPLRTGVSTLFILIIYSCCSISYSFPNSYLFLVNFPTEDFIRLTGTEIIKNFFDSATNYGGFFFDTIQIGIRIVLDWLEVVFVNTPWIVISAFIIFFTTLSAGKKAASFATLFLIYIGLFGFWEKAMTTLALLGTAACISISLGIPLGMFCARRPRFYAVIRPIMDFMQTMPSFVFMIPVIAFFGTGKPAAVIITMIFGGTPVVRLTVLGIQGVPAHVREAALAFGASKWYLLRKIDIPLAAPSILTGINQTIMLSLAMVVVASLIGAKGLGEDVLEALQYASVGQGILAGFSILFCALILNKIMLGKK